MYVTHISFQSVYRYMLITVAYLSVLLLWTAQVAATPETDGGGSGGDPEEGALPMDSDNGAAEEGQKQSPEEVSGPESGQCEPDADDHMRTETTSRDARAGEK
jgi:THO complex subunit 1